MKESLDCAVLCWATQDKIPTFWYLHSGPAFSSWSPLPQLRSLLLPQVPCTASASVPVLPPAQHDFSLLQQLGLRRQSFAEVHSGWSSFRKSSQGLSGEQLPRLSYFLSLTSVSFTPLSYSWEFIYSNNIYRKPGRDKVLF